MGQGFYGFPNIVGLLRATAFRALGKAGATAGAELAGGTTSGAPTSGEHVVGELVVDHTGTLWICTGAGTPGTWTQVVGGSGSYTLPDATTTTTGGTAIEQAPPSGHPRALTTMSRGVGNGLAAVGTDGMLSSMASPLLGEATGVVAEATRWVQSPSNPLFGGTLTNAAQEPNVLVEDGAIRLWYTQDLNGVGSGSYLAYTACGGDPTVPANWSACTKVLGLGGSGYSGAVEHTSVTKIDGVYYCYFADNNSGNLKLSTAADGVSWTAPTTVIAQGQVAWSAGWNNSYVWQEGATWYMLLEGQVPGGLFQLTLATSADGLAWTFPTGAFLTTLQPGGVGTTGGPWMMSPQKRNGLYHLWYHGSSSNADTPTDVYHATATSLTGTWTITDGGSAILAHSGSGIDQYADPCVFEWAGATYVLYERVDNATNLFEMCIASVPTTVAQLIDGARQLDGVANGFATLNGSGHVTPAQLVAGSNVSIDGTTGAIGAPAGFTDPSTTEGDLLYRHSGALARLGTGAAGTYLGSDGTDPAWSVPALQPSSLLVLLPNVNNFVADGTSDEQPPDFITLSSGDVVGVGGM